MLDCRRGSGALEGSADEVHGATGGVVVIP